MRGFAPYLPLRERIESFWLDPRNQRGDPWTGHRDINEVMLASSLVPEECLVPIGSDRHVAS